MLINPYTPGAGKTPAYLAGRDNTIAKAEEALVYMQSGSLDEHDAKEAITRPAENRGVSYKPTAVNDIVKLTEGYPYFIQEFGKQVWQYIENNAIDDQAIEKALPGFHQSLDNSFFRVRFERATPKEKEFMHAMVACGDLPCTLASVAKNMKSTTKTISPIRANLIHKGFIYPTRYGEIDFTVPQFDLFLKRMETA